MDRSARPAVKAAVGVAVALTGAAALTARPAAAQTTVSVSSLFLSSGAEIGLSLYGTGGGQSDRIDVQNQFNFSSSSPGTYIVGFSKGDDAALIPGSTFTLVTFGSTNFTNASSFQAAPRGDFASIEGTFELLQPDPRTGARGSLLFTLGSYAVVPEPGTLPLLLCFAIVGGVLGGARAAARYRRHHRGRLPLPAVAG